MLPFGIPISQVRIGIVFKKPPVFIVGFLNNGSRVY